MEQNKLNNLHRKACEDENCKGFIIWDVEEEVFMCNECLTLYE